MTNIQWLVPSQIEAVTRPFLHTHKQCKTKELAATMAFSHAQFHRNSVNYYHVLRRLRTILLCTKCPGKPAYGHTQIWPNNCCQWKKSRLHTIYRVYFLSNCKDIDYPENSPKTTSVFAQEENLNENGRRPRISHAALAWLVGITPDGVKYHLQRLTLRVFSHAKTKLDIMFYCGQIGQRILFLSGMSSTLNS